MPPSQIQLKLRTLGDEFEDRFRTQFDDMVDQLHITDRTVHALFDDGNINWGTIKSTGCGNPFCTHVTDNDPPKPNKATIIVFYPSLYSHQQIMHEQFCLLCVTDRPYRQIVSEIYPRIHPQEYVI
jgi:hypothetical protein